MIIDVYSMEGTLRAFTKLTKMMSMYYYCSSMFAIIYINAIDNI